jgi:hypothetical protein
MSLMTKKQGDRLERLLKAQVASLNRVDLNLSLLVKTAARQMIQATASDRLPAVKKMLDGHQEKIARSNKRLRELLEGLSKDAQEEDLANAKDEKAASQAVKKAERERRAEAKREAEEKENLDEFKMIVSKHLPKA